MTKPSLADFSVVDKLVRDFIASVLQIKTNFQLGLESEEAPLDAIEERARKASTVIFGRDPSYEAQPWNAENRLGMALRVLLPAETKHYGDSGTGLFMWLANQAMKACTALEKGENEEDVQARVNAVCDDVIARLLGPRP